VSGLREKYKEGFSKRDSYDLVMVNKLGPGMT
jgi:hypothetical protein